MTGQSVRGAYSLVPISPQTQEHEQDNSHRCGRCANNPFNRNGRPDCPNAVKSA